MEKLIKELKIHIIKALQLNDVTPDDIGDDDLLVGGKLGIDSVDILELVMMVEEHYSILIQNKEVGAKVFSTVRALAEFIQENASMKSVKTS